MEQDEVSDWISRINKSKPPAIRQKVIPVDQSRSQKNEAIEEVQLSCYIEKELMKNLKVQALKEENTIKNIINKSITLYLKSND